jgi:hypothetical protein
MEKSPFPEQMVVDKLVKKKQKKNEINFLMLFVFYSVPPPFTMHASVQFF